MHWWQPEYRSKVGGWFRTPVGRRLGFGIGAVATAGAAGTPWPLRLLLAFTAAVLGEGAGRAFSHEGARKDWQIELRNYLQAVVTKLEEYHEDDSAEFRANVMLIDQGRLRIAYPYGRYSKEELQLRWGPREGTAGHAWADRETQVAPAADNPLPRLADAQSPTRPWGMTREHILETAMRVQWVISVPLSFEDDPSNTVVGVFNVDDSQPPKPATKDTVPAEVETMALQVARRLQRAGLQFPSPPSR